MPAEKWRVTRAQKRLEGECYRCTCAAVPGLKLCAAHTATANEAARRYYDERKEQIALAMRTVQRDTRRNQMLVREYGLTLTEYNATLASQGGVCRICRGPETRTDKYGMSHALAVDHDHESGALRGLLCHRCNRVLGLMRDDAAMFTSAANYLKEFGNG